MRANGANNAQSVFAHLLADARRDPGTLRLFDQLLHPTPTSVPASPQALRLRQLADLAMRVEVHAWPSELVDTLLRLTDLGERSLQQTPRLPGYFALLEEPSLTQHAGEVRLWTRGYANPDDAKRLLTAAHHQLDRLMKLNQRWEKCSCTLDETLAELPWYLEAIEALPELREPWQNATISARAIADTLKQKPDDNLPWATRVDNLTHQVAVAENEVLALQQHRQALHAPFSKDAVAKLERQCRSPHADARMRQNVHALLSVAAPTLRAEERVKLGQALQIVSRRLNEETLALDRQDDETQRRTPVADVKPPIEDETRRAALRASWQLALLELAGVSDARLTPLRDGLERCKKDANLTAPWYDLGGVLRNLTHRQMAEQWRQETGWRERERLAWLMPPLAVIEAVDRADVSPTIAHLRRQKEQRDRWVQEHHRYLARDYRGLNFESAGIIAARAFYTQDSDAEPAVRMKLVRPAEALTEKNPYADLMLQVTRHVPANVSGAVEIRYHRPDDVWLEVCAGRGHAADITKAGGRRGDAYDSGQGRASCQGGANRLAAAVRFSG